MKKSRERFQIAPLRARDIDNRPRGEEQTKHRAHPVKRRIDLRMVDDTPREFFELRAKFFEQFPSVDPFELAQLRETSGHRQRISRQRPRLIHGTIRRKLIHDFGRSTERTDWQSTADYLSQCCKIGFDSIDFLGAAACQTETGNYFVKNQKRAIGGAFVSQHRQELIARKIKTRVGRNRLHNYRCDFSFVLSKCLPYNVGIVERQ